MDILFSEFDYSLIVIPFITLLAFFIKSSSGFGTALIMVPVNSVVIGVRNAIVLSSILDLLGGMILYFQDTGRCNRKYLMPMASGMVVCSIIGGIILNVVPVKGFDIVLGVAIIILGIWFVTGRGRKDESTLSVTMPDQSTFLDVAVASFSGLCGGLFGISGPPIVFHLGRKLAKTAFRSTLIVLFMYTGLARVLTYSAVGLMDFYIISLMLLAIPGLLLGLYLGNHLFIRISEAWFSRFIGIVLLLSAVRIINGCV